MSTATHVIKASMEMSTFVAHSYLGDLSDEHLLIRPVKGSNHIAWQLGHLIVSENSLINMVCPGTMPDLPDGFAERYTKETASLDDASAFHTKEEYLELMAEQRAATLAALEALSDDQLDQPGPEEMRDYAPTIAATFALQGAHIMMHSGQWVLVRRTLGLPPLF